MRNTVYIAGRANYNSGKSCMCYYFSAVFNLKVCSRSLIIASDKEMLIYPKWYKVVQGRSYLQRNTNRKSYPTCRILTLPTTVNDLFELSYLTHLSANKDSAYVIILTSNWVKRMISECHTSVIVSQLNRHIDIVVINKLYICVEKEDGGYRRGKYNIEIFLTEYAISFWYSSSLFMI